jgi:heme O synthase-like polyprenyltransferase
MQLLKTLAQTLNADELNIPKVDGTAGIGSILNIVYVVAGIVAVIVIIIAGYTYTTSSGDAGAIKKAKNMILYSVIGIVVIGLAFVITQFVAGRF